MMAGVRDELIRRISAEGIFGEDNLLRLLAEQKIRSTCASIEKGFVTIFSADFMEKE